MLWTSSKWNALIRPVFLRFYCQGDNKKLSCARSSGKCTTMVVSKNVLVPELYQNRCFATNCYPINKRLNWQSTNSINKRQLSSEITDEKLSSTSNSKDVNVNVTAFEIKNFLVEKGISHKQGHCCFITSCPEAELSPAEKHLVTDQLYINMRTGFFVCQNCGKAGNWNNLTENVKLCEEEEAMQKFKCFSFMDNIDNIYSQQSVLLDRWKKTISLDKLSTEEETNLIESFQRRHLKISVLSKYNVQYDKEANSIIFPYFHHNKDLACFRELSLNKAEQSESSSHEAVFPNINPSGIFGWNIMRKPTKDIVLTANEVDAMVVTQESKMLGIALPNGFHSLPQEFLPTLEKFRKIILWFGDDLLGWERAKEFSKKLGPDRCYIIRPSPDCLSPYKALSENKNLDSILSKSKSISHKSITLFSDLRQEVFNEFAHIDQVTGVKWKRYTALNNILKGHRRGELTIFTGPTGSGKTTFISDYSLDLAMQGVNTLWGSFEINNVRLLRMILTQYARIDFSKNLKMFNHWANKLEELPLYFMTFHGQETLKNVIKTMEHAQYVHDIEHVIIDNLQFMMGSDTSSDDKFSKQDQIVGAFRQFATNKNCHVTLVIHPRKEKSGEDLTTSSIFGSAKATQEADNVMIIQDKRMTSVQGKKYLQITKNRFDGDVGVIPLTFDKESLTFFTKRSVKKTHNVLVTDPDTRFSPSYSENVDPNVFNQFDPLVSVGDTTLHKPFVIDKYNRKVYINQPSSKNDDQNMYKQFKSSVRRNSDPSEFEDVDYYSSDEESDDWDSERQITEW